MSTLRLAGFGTAFDIAAVIGGTIIGSVAAHTLTPVSSPAYGGVVPVAANASAAGKYCEAFLKAYADGLGVEVSALGPAASKAAASTIAAAVKAGDITQAQADKLTARLKDAQLGGCPRFANRIGQERPAAGVMKDGFEGVAAALGLTPAQLRAELKSGVDLKELAATKGVPYATVTAAALAPVKAKLDAAVAAGTIKRARADKILARLEANLADGRFRGERPAASGTPGG